MLLVGQSMHSRMWWTCMQRLLPSAAAAAGSPPAGAGAAAMELVGARLRVRHVDVSSGSRVLDGAGAAEDLSQHVPGHEAGAHVAARVPLPDGPRAGRRADLVLHVVV